MELDVINSGPVVQESHCNVSELGVVGSCQPRPQDQIRRGAETFALIERERSHTWAQWKDVIIALNTIDVLGMREAKTNKPRGGKFNQVVGKFLRCYGLDRIHKSDRSRMREFAGRVDIIDAWRNGQPLESQLELNHPRVVFNRWNRSLRPVSDENKKKNPPEVTAVLAGLQALTDEQLTTVWTGFKLESFLRTLPKDWRTKLERRGGEPVLLRESEVLRQALGQIWIAAAPEAMPAAIERAENQALVALRTLATALADVEIDSISLVNAHAKANRCVKEKRSGKGRNRAA